MSDPYRRYGNPDYGRQPQVPAPQQQPQYYYQPPVFVAAPQTSGLAIASLIFGLIGVLGGWCAFGIPCLIAVLCGHGAMRDTRNGQRSGRGMAIAGLILGYIVVIPAAVLTVMMVISMATQSAVPTVTPTFTP